MRTVRRAFAVLDCFSAARPRLSLQEVASALGLAKSTTFRLLKVLEGMGYLVRLDNHKYCLSLKFTRLGGLAEATLDVCAVARPVMEALARSARESVTLLGIDAQDFVCLDVVKGSAPLPRLNQPGDRAPLSLGAASLVLIAYLPQERIKPMLPAIARRVRHSRRDLLSIFATVRKQQYAVSHGGSVSGVSALSVPLYGADDQVRYSLNVVMPTARVRGRVAPLLDLLRKAGRKVSSGLGASAQAGGG